MATSLATSHSCLCVLFEIGNVIQSLDSKPKIERQWLSPNYLTAEAMTVFADKITTHHPFFKHHHYKDQHLPFEYSNRRLKHTKNTHGYLFAKILNVVKLTNFLPIEPRWCSLFTFSLTAKLGTLPEGVQPSGRAPSFPLEACKMGEPLAAMVGPSMSQLDHALTNMNRGTMRLL